jgi:hypothetical protein
MALVSRLRCWLVAVMGLPVVSRTKRTRSSSTDAIRRRASVASTLKDSMTWGTRDSSGAWRKTERRPGWSRRTQKPARPMRTQFSRAADSRITWAWSSKTSRSWMTAAALRGV